MFVSTKLQIITISLSATPINRRCGFLFGKVSPHFPTIIYRLSAKTREWKTRDGANVYFKPLRDSEYGKVY